LRCTKLLGDLVLIEECGFAAGSLAGGLIGARAASFTEYTLSGLSPPLAKLEIFAGHLMFQ
jgi:hypothetical protein